MQRFIKGFLRYTAGKLFFGNCFQLKGTAAVESGTADHKKMKELMEAKKPGLPGKELVKISVKEIFTCLPGPDAGKKL